MKYSFHISLACIAFFFTCYELQAQICTGLMLQTVATAETCGQTNGVASVDPGAGTAPYTYTWNTVPVQTTATAMGLPAGTYQVVVEDVAGCRDSATVLIQSNSTVPQAGFNVSTSGPVATFANNSSQTISWQWDMGDGSVSTLQNPSHTYAAAGTYMVCLIAGNGCGADTLCQPLSITCPEPTAGFSTTINNLSVTFTNQATQATSWYWEFGNGYHAANANPTHSYGTPGTYTVCQIVSNDCGTDTLCTQITVACPEPVAAYSSSATELTVSFSQTSTLATSQVWNFGDGNTSSVANPAHTYATAGTYTACLVVFNECGLDTFCTTITVTCPLPTAGFTALLSQYTASLLNTGSAATSWMWDLGDGTTSTQQHPRHTYAAEGDYTICQIAISACGADTSCQTVSISCPDPVVSFAVTSNGLEATFSDLSADADEWTWDFGDAASSSVQNPVHTYAAEGIYWVCLTVSNECGVAEFCDTVSVLPGCDLQVILIGENPTCSLPNGAIHADVSGGTFPYTYDWSNGDTNRILSNVAEGSYSVRVSDAGGCEVSDSTTIVNTTFPAEIDLGEARSYCEGAFLDAGTSTGIQFLWQDGSTHPVFQVEQTGTYWVEVVNAAGCISRDSVAIQIDINPIAGFAYQATGLEVNFFNGSNQGGNYHWDLGDGNTSDQFQPTHTYATAGSYLVKHIVSNACGSDTIVNTVHVAITDVGEKLPALQVSVFPNPSNGLFKAQLSTVAGQSVRWEIADLQGRTIFESVEVLRGEAHEQVFDLTDQVAGMYLLRVQVGSQHYIQKIALVH